jgi:hypothetical protein
MIPLESSTLPHAQSDATTGESAAAWGVALIEMTRQRTPPARHAVDVLKGLSRGRWRSGRRRGRDRGNRSTSKAISSTIAP